MDGLFIFLVVLSGVISCSPDKFSGSVLEVTVRPGDNITLYCDCKSLNGGDIVWYRNCSHENQPTLVLRIFELKISITDPLRSFPHFQFLRNESSGSNDLLITNITDSLEGLYYCGAEQIIMESKDHRKYTYNYTYGDVTRIICDTSEPQHHEPQEGYCSCWTLLFTLCPGFAVLSSLLSSLVVYQHCQKKVREPHVDQERPNTRGQRRMNQDEDVCYAALEIRQPSQKPMKKKTKSSDFSTYSAINISGV